MLSPLVSREDDHSNENKEIIAKTACVISERWACNDFQSKCETSATVIDEFFAFFLSLQLVNTEEELLEFEATQFPILQTMVAYKEPYDKLWRTALTFHNKHEAWLNGEGCPILRHNEIHESL